VPEVSIIVKAKDQASKTLSGIGKSVSGLSGMIGGLGLAAPLALGAVGAGVVKLAWDAMELEPTRITFENLAESIGTTSEALLAKLHPATMSMVSDADLMRAANKFMAMGLAETSDEAAKLSEMAVKLGMAMGKGPTQAMEEFALMLANQSIPRLDTFGISAGKVRTRINELMQANKDLTREQAFMNAVMEQGNIAMGKVGDISDTTAVKMAKVRAVVSDIKTDIGQALIPILDTAAEAFLNTKKAIADVAGEKERTIKITYEAVESEQEFIDAMYDTLPPLIKQEILLSESKKAVFDLAYAKEYEKKKSEELIAILGPLTESYTDMEHEIQGLYKVGDKLIRDIYKPMASSLKELYESQMDVATAPSPYIWFADLEEAAKNIETAIRYTTDARIIGAEQALGAERGSYDDSLAAARGHIDQLEAAYKDAQTRLEETRAGMHGVPGAYDVQAITSEAVEVYKSEWQKAQGAVEVLEEAHIAKMAGLTAGYETAVAHTVDPALKRWQDYYADLQAAEKITGDARAKTMLESWATALPTFEEIIADMVRSHEISLGEIPLEHRRAVADVLLEWAGVGPELEEEGSKWDTIVGEKMRSIKKSFIDDTFDPAIKRVRDYRDELKDLDGEEVHVYIYEHRRTIQEGAEEALERAIGAAGMEGP